VSLCIDFYNSILNFTSNISKIPEVILKYKVTKELRYLLFIMKKLNILSSETIYMGDTVNDIKMVKNGIIRKSIKSL